jgi:hypothetical protein
MKLPYLNAAMVQALTDNCEGAWLEIDTAQHVGFSSAHRLTQRDLKSHIRGCEVCINSVEMEGAFDVLQGF